MRRTGGQRIRHDERGILDGSTPAAVADVHGHDPGLPFRRVRDPVVHPDIVYPAVGVIVLAHIFGIVDIPHIQDDVFVSAREGEQVIVGCEDVVDSTGQALVVRRRHRRVRRSGHVEDHHAVAPIRGALTRHRGIAPVR